ncbi:LolA-related protein [Uliginosibacterium paludis]|uniref:LolA-related protein n=1 Tax=Uliginosibacterium paludis TaxID=1615952 RepID=A0ABV2CN01_9RHOO
MKTRPLRPVRDGLRLVAGALLCSAGLLAQAAEWTPAVLLEQLAKQKSAQGTFVEKKYIALLDKPAESSGTLSFTAPDKLEKRTLKPKPELMKLDGNQLYIEQAGKAPMSIALGSYPEVAAFVDSIRATLAGDRKALEDNFRLALNGSAAQWKLILSPRYSRMSDVISRVEISGSQAEVQKVAFELPDGDRSEMLISRSKP